MSSRALLALAAAALVGAAGCDVVVDDLLGPPDGTPCYTDDDCVPADCCGEGTRSVHREEAPSCLDVSCSSNCPQDRVGCGCGLPVCRDQRCDVAFRDDACAGE